MWLPRFVVIILDIHLQSLLHSLLFQIIVLSVGQENYGDSAETISEGVKSICAFIRSKQPQAFLVLLVGNPKSRCLDVVFTFLMCSDLIAKRWSRKSAAGKKHERQQHVDRVREGQQQGAAGQH